MKRTSIALCVTTIGLLSGQTLSVMAQPRICYEVQDADGSANVRDRNSKKVVAQIDNGQQVLTDGVVGDLVVLAEPHNQFAIHRSRLRPVRSGVRCRRFTTIEADGYLNLRESPKGKILGRIPSGMALVIIGDLGNKWVRVLLPDGRSGVAYSESFEIYT